MDQRLVAWARAVKSRRRHRGAGLPPLWLFTDDARPVDWLATVRRLPRGLCGVVFRHDAAPGRQNLVRMIWRACRDRRLALMVAGSPISLPGAGRHLRGGRRSWRGRASGPQTSSAHDRAELARASGALCLFVSPAFATASHPGAPALGMVRWAALARRAPAPAVALGGIDGATVRRLPRWAAGAGAIGALLD